jgi:hypothetical protein
MARFQKTQRQISSLRDRADMYSRKIQDDGFKMNESVMGGQEVNKRALDVSYGRRFTNNAKRDLAMRKQYKKRFETFGVGNRKGVNTRESLDMATTQQPWWMKPGGKK